MPDIPSLVDRHERWRADSCVNLQPSENLLSPQVKRALGSDLAGRYTLPWKGDIHGSVVDNAYGGTRYLDEIEAFGEGLAREVFGAAHATLKPLSGHIAGMLMLLSTCRRKDRVLVVDAKHGGYDGYMPPYIPDVLGLDLKVDFLPFREDAWTVDTAKAARKIRSVKPRLVVLGASFLLFPYEIPPLREAADAVGAVLGYDGSHVLGLVAGGAFQRPLQEGADILVGSTHKSMPGPQGGLFLTNRDDVFERFKDNLTWRVMDNAHWNRIAGVAQALLEMKHFGAAYAKAVVENARTLARALDEEGFPVKYRDLGYTRSHQIHLDEVRLREGWGLTPNEFSVRCGRNNLIVDAVARLGSQEVTRMGAGAEDMREIAGLTARAAKGDDVTAAVKSVRSRLRLSYCFG